MPDVRAGHALGGRVSKDILWQLSWVELIAITGCIDYVQNWTELVVMGFASDQDIPSLQGNCIPVCGTTDFLLWVVYIMFSKGIKGLE